MTTEADSFQDLLFESGVAEFQHAGPHAGNIEEPPEHASNGVREKRLYPAEYMHIVWRLSANHTHTVRAYASYSRDLVDIGRCCE